MCRSPPSPVRFGLFSLLLHDVGGPAGDSCGDEEGGVLRDGDAHDEVGHAAGEIDVGEDALLVVHDLLDLLADLEPLDGVGALAFCVDAPETVQDGGAVVAVLVDAVAEAHDLALGGEGVFHEGLDVVECADFFDHVHRGFVGAAVERALEGGDRAGDGAVHVGERAGDDAGGECAWR